MKDEYPHRELSAATPRIALISAREVVASKYLRSSASSAVPSQNARAKEYLRSASVLIDNRETFKRGIVWRRDNFAPSTTHEFLARS